jgi:hypothetical protein
MKRKNLMLSVAAAAVLGAFNPAFAGGGAKHGSADDMSSPPRAEQSGSSSVEQSSSASQSGSINAEAGADTSASADINRDATVGANVGAGASAQPGENPDKLTGLDRADQVAGDHGQQGRDNAREKQGLN